MIARSYSEIDLWVWVVCPSKVRTSGSRVHDISGQPTAISK